MFSRKKQADAPGPEPQARKINDDELRIALATMQEFSVQLYGALEIFRQMITDHSDRLNAIETCLAAQREPKKGH